VSNGTLTDVLIAKFPEWLAAYDQYCPFTRFGQLAYHVETVQMRRALGSAERALENPLFQKSLYRTLQAWRIGERASKLSTFSVFVEALQAKKSEVCALENISIDQDNLDITEVSRKLARLIQSLDIVENRVRVVPGSKALHHFLPDLMVPVDRGYTQVFFGWPTPRLQYNPEECIVEAFHAFAHIARACKPIQYVGAGWYTCQTKVIDNAIVGLMCWAKQQVKQEQQEFSGDEGAVRR
jgi:hypothetical protein